MPSRTVLDAEGLNSFQVAPGADMSGVNLTDRDLSNADLSGAKFTNATLIRTNFTDSSLNNADFSGADLNNATLNNANLSGATLNNANLSGATLNNTTLNNANFTGATLTGVTSSGITPADGTGVTLPAGYSISDGKIVPPWHEPFTHSLDSTLYTLSDNSNTLTLLGDVDIIILDIYYTHKYTTIPPGKKVINFGKVFSNAYSQGWELDIQGTFENKGELRLFTQYSYLRVHPGGVLINDGLYLGTSGNVEIRVGGIIIHNVGTWGVAGTTGHSAGYFNLTNLGTLTNNGVIEYIRHLWNAGTINNTGTITNFEAASRFLNHIDATINNTGTFSAQPKRAVWSAGEDGGDIIAIVAAGNPDMLPQLLEGHALPLTLQERQLFNMSGKNLSNGNFSNINLSGAIFTNATLNNANFTDSNLTNVTLTGATLTNANLAGIISSGITPADGTGVKLPTGYSITGGEITVNNILGILTKYNNEPTKKRNARKGLLRMMLRKMAQTQTKLDMNVSELDYTSEEKEKLFKNKTKIEIFKGKPKGSKTIQEEVTSANDEIVLANIASDKGFLCELEKDEEVKIGLPNNIKSLFRKVSDTEHKFSVYDSNTPPGGIIVKDSTETTTISTYDTNNVYTHDKLLKEGDSVTIDGTEFTIGSIASGGVEGATQQSSSVVGDPYVCSLKTGEVWKMPNFEGYSRMLQGTIDNQQLTINVKTTFNTDEEIKETVNYVMKWSQTMNVDYATLLRTHRVAAKRESFMRELWVQLGQKEIRINMEQLIASNNAFSVSQTDNQAFMVDYDCHDSNNLRIDLTDDLHIIISKFDNPQVKTGFSLKGNTSQIKNTSGALCNKLYKEDMILEEITSIEPIQQLEDRAPKGNSNEIYYNTEGNKVSKSIPYF